MTEHLDSPSHRRNTGRSTVQPNTDMGKMLVQQPITGETPVLQPDTGETPVLRPDMDGTPVVPSGEGQPPLTTETVEVKVRHGARLPHWTREGAVYFVTFRLADSLPVGVVEAWRAEREQLLLQAKAAGAAMIEADRQRLVELFSARVDRYLDAGEGHCWLAAPAAARTVQEALVHFDGNRYRLVAWAVMPNHVHAVVAPAEGHDLPAILHSWKSFTAKAVNRLLRRRGEFWQAEYYDHLIRHPGDLEHCVRYTIDNPAKSGLRHWPWAGHRPPTEWPVIRG